MKMIRLIVCVTALVTCSLWLLLRSAPAQEIEVIMAGELEYQRYCAVCHGTDGKGGGSMRKFLTIEPSDLTRVTTKNDGRFPFWKIYRIIDGREEVPGHGTREMPVWGARFRTEAGGDNAGSRSQVAGRILGLVFYLEHIQE